MNKRILVVTVVVVVLAIAGVLVFGVKRTPAPASTSDGSVQFTDGITGQSVTDIVGEDTSTGLASDATYQSHVSINGIDTLYSNLTNDQASSVQTAINNYLMARSGLADVQAGVKNDAITQNGNQLQFTVVVIKPQASYQITVQTANQYQTIPSVTFKQAEQ